MNITRAEVSVSVSVPGVFHSSSHRYLFVRAYFIDHIYPIPYYSRTWVYSSVVEFWSPKPATEVRILVDPQHENTKAEKSLGVF